MVGNWYFHPHMAPCFAISLTNLENCVLEKFIMLSWVCVLGDSFFKLNNFGSMVHGKACSRYWALKLYVLG